MPRTVHPIDPPADPGLPCNHCGDPLLATAKVYDGMSLGGLREYQWTHTHGSDVCRPTTRAQPYDGWRATSAVQAVLDARAAAEDALIDEIEETA